MALKTETNKISTFSLQELNEDKNLNQDKENNNLYNDKIKLCNENSISFDPVLLREEEEEEEKEKAPQKHFFSQWKLLYSNSYFTYQLIRITFFILFIDILSVSFIFTSQFALPSSPNSSCLSESIATTLLALINLILGLPGLKVCYLISLSIVVLVIATNSTLSPCFSNRSFFGIISFLLMLIVYSLICHQLILFARFKTHLKLQLGSFRDDYKQGNKKEIKINSYQDKKDIKEEKEQEEEDKKKRKTKSFIKRLKDTFRISPTSFLKNPIENQLRKQIRDAAITGNITLLESLLDEIRKHSLSLAEMYSSPRFSFLASTTYNPLHIACSNGNIAMVDLLLRAGFSPNVYDKVNTTKFSIYECYQLISWMFTTQETNSISYSDFFCTILETPLHQSVSSSHVDIVELLLRNGADPDLSSRAALAAPWRTRPPIFDVDSVAVLECLLRNKANHLIVPGQCGSVQTITVLQYFMLQERTALTQVLEEWGADVALSPLHTAAASGDIHSVNLYLKSGADPDTLGEYYEGINKRTPLHWAAITGKVNTLKILLEHNATVDVIDREGRTPLHWAARHNHLDVVEILLNSGADPNSIDKNMKNVFCTAAEVEDISSQVFEALVDAGGDITATSNLLKDTALHIAMKKENTKTAIALLKAGANIWQVNADGRKAVECTSSTEMQFIIKKHAKCNDVFITYTKAYQEFAEKLRDGIENNFITTSLQYGALKESLNKKKNLKDKSISLTDCDRNISSSSSSTSSSTSSYNENFISILDGISVVLCILSIDFDKDESCLKQLALAKQFGIPVVAIFLNTTTLSEELQVYLFTRQIVPFQSTITFSDYSNPSKILFKYDESKFEEYLLCLLDGLRDEIEIHRLSGNGSRSNILLNPQIGEELNALKGSCYDKNYVFLSHGDCHVEFTWKLYQSLESAGINVFLDSRSNTSDLKERILAAKDAILQCTAFLVVLSEESVKTQLVSDQLAFAEDKGKRIMPIFLNELIPQMEIISNLSIKDIHVFAEDLAFEQSLQQLILYLDTVLIDEKDKEDTIDESIE